VDAERKQIVASLATRAGRGDHTERALRPDAMPGYERITSTHRAYTGCGEDARLRFH
jgi:hypothetical protein